MTIDILDTNKLKLGDCINYKTLCELLNQPTYTGNQKKSQLKEFKRFFDYEKSGTKFIILEIYNKPLSKRHNYPANALYIKYIECILLKFLSTQPGYEVNIFSQDLWLQLGMINDDFIKLQFKQDNLVELDEDMNYFEINDFYKRCKQKFSKIAKDSLESLQNRCLIKYQSIHLVRHINSNILEKATVIEEKYILKAERQALLSLRLEKKSQIYLKNKSRSFYDLRDNNIKNLTGEIDKVFDCWNIIYNQDNVLEALSDDEIKLQKLMLNSEIIHTVNSQAERIYEDNKDNWLQLLDSDDEGKYFEYPTEYICMQSLLSNKLLKIDKNINIVENKNE